MRINEVAMREIVQLEFIDLVYSAIDIPMNITFGTPDLAFAKHHDSRVQVSMLNGNVTTKTTVFTTMQINLKSAKFQKYITKLFLIDSFKDYPILENIFITEDVPKYLFIHKNDNKSIFYGSINYKNSVENE